MLKIMCLTMACLLAGLIGGAAHADQFTPAQRAEIVGIVRDALMRDPSILRDAINALKSDEGDQQKAQLAASRTRLEDGGAVTGNPQGDVTIVEFFDTRCPYCRRMEPVMENYLAQDHKVRLVYKDLPILGPPSVLGSKALLAAHRQGGYEQLRDAIMAGPPQTTKATIKEAAEGLGLDWAQLARDMEDPAIQTQIEQNLKLAQAIGVHGTPAMLIGDTLVPGAVDLPELREAVAAARKAR